MSPLPALIVVLSASTAGAQVIEARVDGRVEPRDLSASDVDYAPAGPIWWQETLSEFGENFIRLHLVAEVMPDTPKAQVVVRASRGGTFSYSLDEIGSEGLWSGLMLAGDHVVTIEGPERPLGLKFRVDEVMIEGNVGTLYSVWPPGGSDETSEINNPVVPEDIRKMRGPIARLSFISDGVPHDCTGFMVAPDLLMTNQHCVASAEVCRTVVVLFDYEIDAQNRKLFGKQFRCRSHAVPAVNFDLDAAVFPLDAPAGDEFGTFAFADTDAADNQTLVLIQHPGGNRKRVSWINCVVLAATVDGRAAGTDLAHSCDTAGGSSGAPVLDLAGQVVALHHYGFAEGQVSDWQDNRAVRGSEVRAWLQTLLERP